MLDPKLEEVKVAVTVCLSHNVTVLGKKLNRASSLPMVYEGKEDGGF